jgi:hypothetical protein
MPAGNGRAVNVFMRDDDVRIATPMSNGWACQMSRGERPAAEGDNDVSNDGTVSTDSRPVVAAPSQVSIGGGLLRR